MHKVFVSFSVSGCSAQHFSNKIITIEHYPNSVEGIDEIEEEIGKNLYGDRATLLFWKALG